MVQHYKGQHYKQEKRRCLRNKKYFEDEEFPANGRSINGNTQEVELEWKRPLEICAGRLPCLMKKKHRTRNIAQGQVGNCWLIATLTQVMVSPYMEQIIPDYSEQEWNTSSPDRGYAGIFRFRFWHKGEHVEVVVDDRLPCRSTSKGYKLEYSQDTDAMSDHMQFWCPLLEKAYAKLFGSYKALDGGEIGEALMDLTGHLVETLKRTLTPEDKEHRFTVLRKAYKSRSPITAAISKENSSCNRSNTDNGLAKGHVYGVIKVKTVKKTKHGDKNRKSEKLRVIQLRDPSGENDYCGSLCHGGTKWNEIKTKHVKAMTYEAVSDSKTEFWMTFDEFCATFYELAICHNMNTSVVSLKKSWKESVITGHWSDQWHREDVLPILNNPQYCFDITTVKSSDQEVFVELVQYKTDDLERNNNMCMSCNIIQVCDNQQYRLHKLLVPIEKQQLGNSRSVFLRSSLQAGRYVILPSLASHSLAGQFRVRLYTTNTCRLRELTQHAPHRARWRFLERFTYFKYPVLVTQVRIGKVHWSDTHTFKTLHACISCEGTRRKSYTRSVHGHNCCDLDYSVVLYRKRNPEEQPITIDLYASSGALHRSKLISNYTDAFSRPTNGSKFNAKSSDGSVTYDVFITVSDKLDGV